MRVGIRDAERLKDSPSSAPVCALGHLPPCGGRLLGCSNREGLIPLWDVWIHILGIWVECACWEAGGPSVPPLRRRRGKPGRRVQEAAPYKRGYLQSGRVRTPAPTADVETYLSFRRDRSQTGSLEGHTPGWLLSAFGRFTFSPSPTTCPERFQFFVGEPLGAPAGNVPHLKRAPSSVWPNGQPPSP